MVPARSAPDQSYETPTLEKILLEMEMEVEIWKESDWERACDETWIGELEAESMWKDENAAHDGDN